MEEKHLVSNRTIKFTWVENKSKGIKKTATNILFLSRSYVQYFVSLSTIAFTQSIFVKKKSPCTNVISVTLNWTAFRANSATQMEH
jgi:hypothetical protein